MFIRHSTARTAIGIGNLVFKIPVIWPLHRAIHRFDIGIRSNKSEARFWQRNKDNPRFALCPIIYSHPSGFLNIMPRLELLSQKDFEAFAGHLDNPDDYDLNVENFGWYCGDIVCLDYEKLPWICKRKLKK